jgi:hypothetical protein
MSSAPPKREKEKQSNVENGKTKSVKPKETQVINYGSVEPRGVRLNTSEDKQPILQDSGGSSAPPSSDYATQSPPSSAPRVLSSIQANTQDQEKANTSDALKERDETRADYWDKLDALFYGTVKHAETAFTINVILNILVAAVGLVILFYSIAYSWTHGLDLYTTAFGSLGVVSFIALFYFTPQKKIQKTMGDLAQLQMLYRTYFMQAEEVNDLCYRHNPRTIEEVEKINNHLKDVTCAICKTIEDYVGEKGE